MHGEGGQQLSGRLGGEGRQQQNSQARLNKDSFQLRFISALYSTLASVHTPAFLRRTVRLPELSIPAKGGQSWDENTDLQTEGSVIDAESRTAERFHLTDQA